MDHAKKHNTVASLVTILIVLMVLLAISVLANRMEQGAVASAVAMGIATVKALVVAYFFMDLRIKSPLTRIFASAGLLWLVIMFVLMFTDFLSRGY